MVFTTNLLGGYASKSLLTVANKTYFVQLQFSTSPKGTTPVLKVPKKKFATPTLTPITLKSFYRSHNYILINLALLLVYLHFPLGPLAEQRVSDSRGTRL